MDEYDDLLAEFDSEDDDWDDSEEDDLDYFEDDDLDAVYFAGEDNDAAERRRRKGRRALRRQNARLQKQLQQRKQVKTAPRSGSFKSRLSGKPVTEPQLRAITGRLDRKIAANAAGIKRVNSSVNSLVKKQARDTVSLAGRMDRHANAIRKEMAKRKKAMDKVRNDIQMAMLMPMLMKKESIEVPKSTLTEDPTDTETINVSVESDDTMTMMLPLMMMGGFGGEGGSDNNMMMMMMLAMNFMG